MDKERYAERIRGALFDLMGYLTQLDDPVTFGKDEDAAPAVDVLKEFMTIRGIAEGGVNIDWDNMMDLSEAKAPPSLKLVDSEGKPLTRS